MFIEAKTVDDLLRKSHKSLLTEGIPGKSSRGPYVGLQGVLLELSDPRARISRSESRGKIVSCLGELVWILSGSKSLYSITPYISNYVNESEDGKTVRGAYGPRIFSPDGSNQFETVASLLRKKPGTRRAIIQILEPDDLNGKRKEVPCTCYLQFRIVNQKLVLIVSMRSNDAFWGLPHDVFVFTMLQELMANKLGVEVGAYKHFAGDFHLYDKHKKKAESFLSEGWASTLSPMPPMPVEECEAGISFLIGAEEKIRTGICNVEIPDNIPTYWRNLLGFIGMHIASREKNRILAKEFSNLITEPAFQIFIHDRELHE